MVILTQCLVNIRTHVKNALLILRFGSWVAPNFISFDLLFQSDVIKVDPMLCATAESFFKDKFYKVSD